MIFTKKMKRKMNSILKRRKISHMKEFKLQMIFMIKTASRRKQSKRKRKRNHLLRMKTKTIITLKKRIILLNIMKN